MASILSPTYLSVPITICCYKEVHGYSDYHYRLQQVLQSKENVDLPNSFLKKRCLLNQDLEDIKWHVNVYVTEFNRKRVLFLFKSRSGDVLCRIGSSTKGEFEVIDQGACGLYPLSEDYWDVISKSEPSLSVHSFFVHFQEIRRDELTLRGITSFPSASVSIPHWFSSKTAEQFFKIWYETKVPTMKNSGLVTVVLIDGSIKIFKLYHSEFGKPNPLVLTK